jgi:acyl-CoA synthetase (AMP-forming)/AMP-acid ligase II/thioesterase domain-containing protein/acyl carrier protein
MHGQMTMGRESEALLKAPAAPQQPTTLGAAIRLRAETQPNHPAIVSSGFAAFSYLELQSLIDHVRAALRGSGFGRNTRIAIAMPNGTQAALGIVAVSCSAVGIPVNPKQTLREIEACFDALRPDAVLLAKGDDSDARRAAESKGVAIIEATPTTDGTIGFSLAKPRNGAVPATEADEPDPKAAAFILQTSGSAAEPKLIPFSHRNMLAAAARLQSWFNLTPQDRCLSVSPPFYSHGLKVTLLAPLLTGGTVTFPADAAKFDYAEWFEDLRPTWYSAGPTLHRMIFDQTQSNADAQTGHSLRFILSGGAPLPRNVLEGLQDALGVPVVEHYGSSEAAQIAANLPQPGRSKFGTCGIPWPGTVIIAGEDGEPLPANQQGEILVGGPTLISGYLNAPALNEACFVNDWFKTGDLGSLDDDGFLTLHGRISDVINRGGEKISPLEIDDALLRHPAVAEAAAFAIPHERLGEDVAAAVVLRAGMTANPVELRRYLQDQLASYKIPRRVLIRNELPKGKTGKVLRRLLVDLLSEKARPESATKASPVPDHTAAASTLVIQMTELWERLLRTTPIALDDDFFEKGGDSLLAVEMLLEVEQLTGRNIPTSILFEARTIRQIAQMLQALDIQPQPIIKMNPGGNLKPIFLFHGDYNGGGLYTAKLAKLLSEDQPLFVVAPHDLGKEPVTLPIEAMAAEHLPLVLEAQPKGPYRLSGYCLGGLIAFEVARLLVSRGEKVEMVGMIDTPTVGARPSLKLLLSTIRLGRPIAESFIDRVMRRVWYIYFQSDVWFTSLRKTNIFRWGTDDRLSSTHSLVNYSPDRLAVPVIYFEAEYSSAAWRRMGSSLDMIELEGNHAAAVRDPANHAKIAHHLQTWTSAGK